MLKLVKYEFKGRVKFISICLCTLIFGYFIVLDKISFGYPGMDQNQLNSLKGLALYAPFAFALIAVIVSGIRLHRRDIYGQTGYLMFAIPKEIYVISASKMIELTLEMIIMGGVSSIFIIPNIIAINSIASKDIISCIFNFLAFILVNILAANVFILLAWFSETVGKVTSSSKRVGNFVGYIILISLIVVTGMIDGFAVKAFSINSAQHEFIHIINIQHGSFNFEFLPIVVNSYIIMLYFIFGISAFIGSSLLLKRRMNI